MTSTSLARTNGRKPSRKQRVLEARASGSVARRSGLPEYLVPGEVNALINAAPHGQARLLILEGWRAGLKVSEAVALEAEDLQLDGDNPTLRIRHGKGGRSRIVPVHPELAAALRQVVDFGSVRRGRLVTASRSTVWRWVKDALSKAQERGGIPEGRWVGTHTLRHSAARHWLASGVPINVVSRWLGHASIQTTLTYLESCRTRPGTWKEWNENENRVKDH